VKRVAQTGVGERPALPRATITAARGARRRLDHERELADKRNLD